MAVRKSDKEEENYPYINGADDYDDNEGEDEEVFEEDN
jgi:hypothetical protein